MGVHFALISHKAKRSTWVESPNPLRHWNLHYRPPWILFLHILSVILLFVVFIIIIEPVIQSTFVSRKIFASQLTPEHDQRFPWTQISDIEDFLDKFNDNLENLLYHSFLDLYLTNPDVPYTFKTTWVNGSITESTDFEVSLEIFHHIDQLHLSTSFYYVSPRASLSGCTKWTVGTHFHRSAGSFTFSSYPDISRENCPLDFFEQVIDQNTDIIDEDDEEQVNAQLLSEINTLQKSNQPTKPQKHARLNRKRANLKKKKSGQFSQRAPYSLPSKAARHIGLKVDDKIEDNSGHKKQNKIYSSKFIQEENRKHTKSNAKTLSMTEYDINPRYGYLLPILPDRRLPIRRLVETITTCLVLISLFLTVLLFISIIQGFIYMNIWKKTDSAFKDLSVSDQVHTAIGYWNLIHFFVSIVQLITTLVIFHDATTSTQYLSMSTLRWFAVTGFLTFCTSCRWFVFTPKMYQLISVIRVSFTRLLSISVGLLPLVCGFMFLGLFIFGFVCDMTRSYVRFFQLYIGLIFGDDFFFVFGYYNDGSELFTVLSFLYVMFIGILSAYVTFPSYTATISFLHHHEVLPNLGENPYEAAGVPDFDS